MGERKPEWKWSNHNWAMGWPGNFCKTCGMDDYVELACSCPDCHTPCGPEDKDQEIRFCAIHQAMADTPCKT
jgi:hypothetical protein